MAGDTIKVVVEEPVNTVFLVTFLDSPHTGCLEIRGVAFSLEDAVKIIKNSPSMMLELPRMFLTIEHYPVGVQLLPESLIEMWCGRDLIELVEAA